MESFGGLYPRRDSRMPNKNGINELHGYKPMKRHNLKPSPRAGKGDHAVVDEVANIWSILEIATSSASFLGTFPALGEGLVKHSPRPTSTRNTCIGRNVRCKPSPRVLIEESV